MSTHSIDCTYKNFATSNPKEGNTDADVTPDKRFLVSYKDLDEWRQDNEFILHSYRPLMTNYQSCVRSVVLLHSESGNIWSHLIAFLIFAGCLVEFLTRDAAEFVDATRERFVITVFMISVLATFGFSTTLHTFMCHSEPVLRRCCSLDYTGITFGFIGAFIPLVFYNFYCEPRVQKVYYAVMFCFGVLCLVAVHSKRFETPKYRGIRALVFVALGLSSLVMPVHLIATLGFHESLAAAQLDYQYVAGGICLFGAFVFAYRIPERYFPGKCDFWFQSHQIFHCCALATAVVHLAGLFRLQKIRFALGENCDAS